MNYYRRYSGDYLRKTSRLNLTEHGAYCLLLDYYYTEEKPLPADHDELYLMVRAMKPDDRKAVDKVLRLFFVKKPDGYHQERADHEIEVSKKARSNGGKGGRPVTEPETGAITGLVTGTETGDITGSITGAVTETLTGSGHPLASNHQPLTANPQPLAVQPPTNVNPASAAPRGERPPKSPKVEAKTNPCWQAYSLAYSNRYGVEPVRNAKVNGMLAKLLDRVPMDELPAIAAFYVGSNRGLYVSSKHCVDLLSRDIEGLRTEWATGRQTTDTEARLADRTQATGNAFAPLIAEAERREIQ